jgi:hypothetical protein
MILFTKLLSRQFFLYKQTILSEEKNDCKGKDATTFF